MLRFQSNAIKEKPLFLPPSPPSFLIYLPRGRNAALGNRTAAPGGTSAFIFQLPRGCPCGGGGGGHGSIEPPAPREPAIISNIHGISRSHRNQIKARFGGGGGGGRCPGATTGMRGERRAGSARRSGKKNNHQQTRTQPGTAKAKRPLCEEGAP